jgi:hypothetical protein
MNEEAIQDSYNVFVSQGYKKSIDEFKKLISTNPEALNDSYEAFVSQGYKKNLDDYKSLMGVSQVKKKVSSELPKQQVPKAGTTELPSADGSLATPRTKEDEEEDYFKGSFSKVLKTIDAFAPIGIGDFIDDMARSVASGYRQGTVAEEADRLLLKGTKASPEQIQKFIDANKNAQKIKPSAEMQDYQKTYEEAGKGFWGVIKGLAKNPTVIPEVMASSLVSMATNSDAMTAAGATIGGGATYGAITGAALTPEFLGAGAVPGAITGAASAIPYAFGMASSVVEAGSTFAELLTEELNGEELTKENVKAILEDPEKYKSIRNKAIARGIVIGTLDALTGKLAGGVGAKIVSKSAAKSAVGAASKKAITKSVAAGSAIEAVGGSAGEAAARLAIGQDMDVSEIALEGLAELPGGIRSTIQARLAKPSYEINGEKVKAEDIDELINTMTPEQLAVTDIKIKNDYQGREFKLRDKVLTNSIKEDVRKANPDLNEPSLNAITELEKQLQTLEGNKTQTGKDKAAAIRTQIKDIQENQLIEETDAIQEQATDESVLRTEQPELGLQTMGEGDTQEETITPTQPQEITNEISFTGKRGQADNISFDGKTINKGEEIELNNVNISQDDSQPDLRSGKYRVRMLSVDANNKKATLTLTDGNEVITTTVNDLRKSEEASKTNVAPIDETTTPEPGTPDIISQPIELSIPSATTTQPEEVKGTFLDNILDKIYEYADPITGGKLKGNVFFDGQEVVFTDGDKEFSLGTVQDALSNNSLNATEVTPTFNISEDGTIDILQETEGIPKGKITPQGAGLKAIKTDKNGNVKRVVIADANGMTHSVKGELANELAEFMMFDLAKKGGLTRKINNDATARETFNRGVQESNAKRKSKNPQASVQRLDGGRRVEEVTPEAPTPVTETVLEVKPQEIEVVAEPAPVVEESAEGDLEQDIASDLIDRKDSEDLKHRKNINHSSPKIEYNGDSKRIKELVDRYNNLTRKVEEDGSFNTLYGARLIEKLIRKGLDSNQTRKLSSALRKAGLLDTTSSDLTKNRYSREGIGTYISDTSNYIANAYTNELTFSATDRLKITKILTKLAKELGVDVASLETEANRKIEKIGVETKAEPAPVVEAPVQADSLKDIESTSKALEGKDMNVLEKLSNIYVHGNMGESFREGKWDRYGQLDNLQNFGDGIHLGTFEQAKDFLNNDGKDGYIYKVKLNSKNIKEGIDQEKLISKKIKELIDKGVPHKDAVEEVLKDNSISYSGQIGDAEVLKYENIIEGKDKDFSYVVFNPDLTKIVSVIKFDKGQKSVIYDNSINEISESYHKAKVDGSNPELVQAVEKLLVSETKVEPTPVVEAILEEAPTAKPVKTKAEQIISQIDNAIQALFDKNGPDIDTWATGPDNSNLIALKRAKKALQTDAKTFKTFLDTPMGKRYSDIAAKFKGANELEKIKSDIEASKKRLKNAFDKYKNMGIAFEPKSNLAKDRELVKSLVLYAYHNVRLGSYEASKLIKDLAEQGFEITRDGANFIMDKAFKKVQREVNKTAGVKPKPTEQKRINKAYAVGIATQRIATDAVKSDVKDLKGQVVDVFRAGIEAVKIAQATAKDKAKNIKEISQQLVKDIKELESTGKITPTQALNMISKFNKVNMLNEVSVSNFVDYMTKVFADADYDNKINVAKGRLKNAKKNIATKIGIADGLVGPLQKLFSINPELIPDTKLERYLELVDMFGARQSVLTLEEKSKLTSDVLEILDEINNERSAVDELSERFNYSENQVIENGKLNYSATVKNMLKEGEITQEEADLMTKYKKEIAPKVEKSSLSEEELQQEKDDLLEEVKKSNINSDELPTRAERDAAKKLASLIKTPAVKELTNVQLKNLLKVIDNINNGYFPHYAHLITEEINSTNNSKVLKSSVNKARLLPLSKIYAKVKSLVTRKDYVLEMIRRNPLFNIDQVIGDFKTKDVFNSILGKAAEAEAKFTSELKAIQSKLSIAEEKIAKSFKLDANKTTMSKFKMMTYMVQLEYQSNQDNKQVNPAAEYLKATIKHIDEGKSQFGEKDANMLQEILDTYTDSEGNIDVKKLYNSFNSAEKAGIKTVQEVNQSLKEKAEYTASVIRGQRINPLSNYIHLNVLSDSRPNDLASGQSFADQYNNSLKPSTKAKSLIERTGKVSPLNFDVFASAQRGAKFVLMDYHLTEPIRTARKTINKTIASLGRIDKEKRKIINAINKSFEETVENLVNNSYTETSVGDDVFDYVKKQGYRSVLAGTGRFAAEFLSNAGFVIFNDPITFAEGLKYMSTLMSTDAPSIMNNVNSKEINRIFPSDTLSGRMIDTNILNEANGIKGSKAKNKIINKVQQLWNLTGKKYTNAVELTADMLITTPDKAIMRPLWFGAFASNFKNETGQDVDFKKIAENNESYMNQYKEAIDKAKNAADEKSVITGASNNAFTGILKGTSKPNQSNFIKGFNNFNSYMSRFLIYEYTAARTGIMAAIGNGSLNKRQGIALLGGVVTRMTVYSLLSKALGSGIIGLLFGDDEDEEEQQKSLDKSIGQALTSTFTSLLFNRDFGNATKMVINKGLEMFNEKYLDALREGDYDPYKDAIQYTAVPIDKKGKQTGIYDYIENVSGAYGPAIKTTNLIIKTYSEEDKKEASAIKRQQDVKNIRIPLEVFGNAGFVPLYKEIRKEVMSEIYKDLKKPDSASEKKKELEKKQIQDEKINALQEVINKSNDRDVKSAAREMINEMKETDPDKLMEIDERKKEMKELKESLLIDEKTGIEYDNPSDLKKYNEPLWEKNFGERSEWYKENKGDIEAKSLMNKVRRQEEEDEYGYIPKKKKKGRFGMDRYRR